MAGVGMKSGSRRLVSAGCGFRKETVAGTRRNERDAPEAAIVEPQNLMQSAVAFHVGD